MFVRRDAMACNFALITKQLQYINGILLLKKSEIADLFNELEIPPFYAISWVLTWFAHDISDFSIVARLYDFFLVHHPSAVLYVSAALVSFHWPKILNCEREFPEVHSLLSKLPKLTEESDWMSILSTAEVWMLYHPYTKLQFVTQQFLPQWSSYNTFEKTWMQLEQSNPVKLCEILDQETLFHNLQTMPDKTSRFAVVSQNINVAAPRDISLITQYVYNAFVTSLGYTPKWVTEDKNKSNYKTIVAVAAAVTTSVSAYLLMVGGQALLNKGYFG
ncbi:TBC1 domain family member 20 [Zancudomyces culisetae]|uniref:TBC1 domain family member 20 n=1 Tax=Zancudomyces culisetae TaxID=1213189 RepID=A0A1R1PJB3_ZANCU|nr:TBC1 domain family member 20 [Zancudomyces culisetae]|eukprot:OMH81046.1 TBC1 domain family member 20 [Zancudomyces culisetae]